jgi:hypothetical protein
MGFPSDIVSDRDTCLTSQFWQEPTNHLGIKLSTSTAFHPQADGEQDDWAELIPLAEHAYNTANSETTKTSPFFANYGYQPETQWIRPACVGGELHLPRELVASSTLERLAASRMSEIAIEHYRKSRIPGRRLNKREKRVEYLVVWKGYPLLCAHRHEPHKGWG